MKQAMAWLLQMLNIKGLVLEPARVNNIFGIKFNFWYTCLLNHLMIGDQFMNLYLQKFYPSRYVMVTRKVKSPRYMILMQCFDYPHNNISIANFRYENFSDCRII